MKTIQIPSSRKKPECVAFDDDLYICFGERGNFEPDNNGKRFCPRLVPNHFEKGLAGPFSAPDYPINMKWIFTPDGGGVPSKGEVDVSPDSGCIESTIPPCPN